MKKDDLQRLARRLRQGVKRKLADYRRDGRVMLDSVREAVEEQAPRKAVEIDEAEEAYPKIFEET